MGCKDLRLEHVQSLRRQACTFLNDPALGVSFKIEYENSYDVVYASSGSMSGVVMLGTNVSHVCTKSRQQEF